MKKIYVIGIGPGGFSYLTLRAKEAIEESQVIVGYTPYLKYVEDIIKDKELVSTGMMKEIERCSLAIEKAKSGKVVSIISTGDAGLYGMAAPVLQLLEEEKDIEVEIVPGVSAAFAAASIVGAPLTHDTVLISLSNLLTPLDKILKRVENCAKADLVMVLYNPKSKTRIEPFEKTVEILKSTVGLDRVVVAVKNALREGQEVIISTVGELVNIDVDMNTVLIIGNESTYVKNGKVITPRGYGI